LHSSFNFLIKEAKVEGTMQDALDRAA